MDTNKQSVNINLELMPVEMQDAYHKLCMPVNNNIKLESVILSPDNKAKIDEFIVETENKEKFIEYGLNPINRIILYGASGTGKTFLTKALSKYFDYTMLYIDIAGALSAGVASENLVDIFNLGNHIGKAVIFLDECDSICWARDDKENDDGASIRRANNTLFQLLDQMNPECIFVAATNLFNNLDPAFVRRFNVKMRFNKPEIDNIDDSIKHFILPKFRLENDMEQKIKEIIKWQGKTYTALSYYEIQDWVERAEKKALISGTDIIKESDIYDNFMYSMRMKLGRKEVTGEPYLYQE